MLKPEALKKIFRAAWLRKVGGGIKGVGSKAWNNPTVKKVAGNRVVQSIAAAAGTAGIMDVAMSGGAVTVADQMAKRRVERLRRELMSQRRLR